MTRSARRQHACLSLMAVSQHSTSASAVSFFLRVIIDLPVNHGPASMNGLPPFLVREGHTACCGSADKRTLHFLPGDVVSRVIKNKTQKDGMFLPMTIL